MQRCALTLILYHVECVDALINRSEIPFTFRIWLHLADQAVHPAPQPSASYSMRTTRVAARLSPGRSPVEPGMSAYELERRATIQANHEFLASLNLVPLVEKRPPAPRAATKPRAAIKKVRVRKPSVRARKVARVSQREAEEAARRAAEEAAVNEAKRKAIAEKRAEAARRERWGGRGGRRTLDALVSSGRAIAFAAATRCAIFKSLCPQYPEL